MTGLPPDYYLVLSGPAGAAPARRPWCIDRVYLFDGPRLLDARRQRGVRIGVAISVPRKAWDDAEIYPNDVPNAPLRLSPGQRHGLALFAERSAPRP